MQLTDPVRDILFVTVPYAGGSSIAFAKVFAGDRSMAFYHHDYPGHGMRLNEPYKNDFHVLAEELAQIIAGRKKDGSELFIMGHSMGAMVSFYCESILEERYGIRAERVILSACLPPELFYENRMKFLNDEEELMAYMAETRKIPDPVLNSRIFRNQMLDPFINDVKAIHAFVPKVGVKVKAGLFCISGSDDTDITPEGMSGWRALTAGSFDAAAAEGDHFYFESDPGRLKSIVKEIVKA